MTPVPVWAIAFLAGLALGVFVTAHVMGDWYGCRAQHSLPVCLVKAW